MYVSKLPTDISEEELGAYATKRIPCVLLKYLFIFRSFLVCAVILSIIWQKLNSTEILFGALGRIKKVKIYTTALGKQKGDALVTFALAETAITACFKVQFLRFLRYT